MRGETEPELVGIRHRDFDRVQGDDGDGGGAVSLDKLGPSSGG